MSVDSNAPSVQDLKDNKDGDYQLHNNSLNVDRIINGLRSRVNVATGDELGVVAEILRGECSKILEDEERDPINNIYWILRNLELLVNQIGFEDGSHPIYKQENLTA